MKNAQEDLSFFSNVLANDLSEKHHDILPDEKPSKREDNFKEIMKASVYANEFVPLAQRKTFIPTDEKPPSVPEDGKPSLERQASFTPEEKAQQILMDHVMTLTDYPGEFDNVIDDLATILTENIKTDELMKESIYIIFDHVSTSNINNILFNVQYTTDKWYTG